MDVYELVRTAFRRWYVALPFLLAGVIGAVLVTRAVEGQYVVEGSLLVTQTPQLFEDSSADLDELDPDAEVDGAAEEDEGLVEAALLAEVINLDGRATTAPEEGSGPSLRAYAIGGETLRIDVFGNDPDETYEILLDKVEEARAVAGRAAVVEPVALPEAATVSSDQRGDYQASVLLRIDRPDQDGESIGGDFAIRIVTEQMQSDESAAAVYELAGHTGGFLVSRDERDQAPILRVAAGGTTPDEADQMWDATQTIVGRRLEALQDVQGVPEADRIGVATLVRDEALLVVEEDGRRFAVVLFGLGAILGLGGAVAVDAVARRRASAAEDEWPHLEVDDTWPDGSTAAGARDVGARVPAPTSELGGPRDDP